MGHGKNYQVERVDTDHYAVTARRQVVDTHLSASKAREKADRRHQSREAGDSHHYEVHKQPKKK
jgi:hypothetical protein